MESEVTITIEGEGLSLIKKTNLQKAGQIISFLALDQDLSTRQYDNTATQQLISAPRLQPRDVIVQSGAKTYPQKIVALAMYLRNQLGQETFTPQEVRIIFKKMGDEPRNFTRDFKAAIDLQYVACTDSINDQYELTSKGAEALEGGFAAEKIKKIGTKHRIGIKGIRDEVKTMEITSTLDGYPDYFKFQTKADKILWLLKYAETKQVSTLTPPEISELSAHLREKIEVRDFASHNKRNIIKGFVCKTAAGFQLQKKGLDYLGSV